MFVDVSVPNAFRALALCFCVHVLPASAEGDLWEWVTPTPQGHDLFAAASGNGVTVAVGRQGTVITGSDGVGWQTSHSESEYRLIDVVWGDGVFVAVGGKVGWEGVETELHLKNQRSFD